MQGQSAHQLNNKWTKAEEAIRGFTKRSQRSVESERGLTSASAAKLFAEFQQTLLEQVVGEVFPLVRLRIDFFGLRAQIRKHA